MVSRREWARKLMHRAPDSPRYGTPEWEALPDGPEKVAAVVRAAECWFLDGEQAPVRLHREINDLRAAYLAGESDGFHARREAWRNGWSRPELLAAEIEAEWREWVGGVA